MIRCRPYGMTTRLKKLVRANYYWSPQNWSLKSFTGILRLEKTISCCFTNCQCCINTWIWWPKFKYLVLVADVIVSIMPLFHVRISNVLQVRISFNSDVCIVFIWLSYGSSRTMVLCALCFSHLLCTKKSCSWLSSPHFLLFNKVDIS